MTPQEFKAWFEGFTEAIDGTPTKAQWKRINERVAEIDGKPVTERVYVDRYLPTYIPPVYTAPTPLTWPYRTVWSSGSAVSGLPQNAQVTLTDVSNAPTFNSMTAMNTLGRIEASNMGAS